MTLTRDDFDPSVLDPMDMLANLIFACNELHKIGRTFKNAADLDRSEAEPHAENILVLCREVATELVVAATYKPSFIIERMKQVRSRTHTKLDDAITSATILADMEEAAMVDVGGNGNWIRKRVLLPLSAVRAQMTTKDALAGIENED